MPRMNDPFGGFRFIIEIEGIVEAGFSEITIPDSSVDVIEYRVCETATVRRNSGIITYSNITLKGGITNSMNIYNWYRNIVNGKTNSSKKNISIMLLDEKGNESSRWNVVRAWPTKYDAPDLKAAGNAIAIETLEIAHEGIQRVK